MIDLVAINTALSVNGWKTSREDDASVTVAGGFTESRFSHSPWPRKAYEIPFDALGHTDRQTLINFYEARLGRVRAFLLWDRDYVIATNQAIGTGNGSTTTFQLVIAGGDSFNSFNKNVLHPIPTGTSVPSELQGLFGATTTTTTIKVAGVTKTEGADYSISPATGIVTFTSAPANAAAITWTGPYYTAVRFDSPLDLTLNSIYGAGNPRLIEVFE